VRQVDQETSATLRQFDTLPDCAFVKMAVVQALRGGITQKGVYDLINSGALPRPIKLGSRLNGWQVGALRKSLTALAEQVAQ